MGNTRVQWGGRGWLVACRGQRQVKVTEKEGTNKMDGEKNKTKIRQKRGVSHKNKSAWKVLGGIDPRPQPRRLWGPPFQPQVPPERTYVSNH
jgi:hypothetical protein